MSTPFDFYDCAPNNHLSTPPLQATALKTSSGKGDLQCSATNAGDWVGFLDLPSCDSFSHIVT